MIDNSLLIAVMVILALNVLLKKYIETTKDVPDLYLSEQSLIESTRLTDQSAIYKSNKLDFGNGLRVGLEIRWNTYKLRHGNFCDVWKILISSLKTLPGKVLLLNDKAISVSGLNFKVKELGDYLLSNNVSSVSIRYNEFLGTEENLVLVMTCLVNSILMTFYQVDQEILHLSIDKSADEVYSFIQGIPQGQLDNYDYDYSFEKDTGVRLRVNRKQGQIINSTDYLAVNFVSSIASTIKHLPPGETLSGKDTLLIINSNPETCLVHTLSKILTGFVSGANIVITKSNNWEKLMSYDPTVLYMQQNDIDPQIVSNLLTQESFLGKIGYKISLRFLSKGKFSVFNKKPLRLLYLHKMIKQKPLFTSSGLNQLRAVLGCHVIVENGYENIIGPVILNDFYDYRVIDPAVSRKLLANGCICQSDEIKLVNVDSNGFGDILVRGYNIGKVNNYMLGKGLAERVTKDNQGFMNLNSFKGKWGNDGCLYIYDL